MIACLLKLLEKVTNYRRWMKYWFEAGPPDEDEEEHRYANPPWHNRILNWIDWRGFNSEKDSKEE